MGGGRTYLAAFAGLHQIDDADERRRVTRQALAMLAQIAEREPAPLEGLPAADLLLAVRTALSDGLLVDLDWMSPAAGAIAIFELAQALPSGPERRELGRRVLTRLRDADRDTFVRLLIALARSSPKLLISEGLRARAEVVLSAPLTAPAPGPRPTGRGRDSVPPVGPGSRGRDSVSPVGPGSRGRDSVPPWRGRDSVASGTIGELALGLLAQPMLAASWIEVPAMGSLPARRLAARILAHGAREAVRRYDAGDRGGVHVLARSGIRAALDRLLGDREALVWRFASIARGILAHVDPDLAAAIDRELRSAASSTELRRGAASAAAALERGGAAARWEAVLAERAIKDPGVARGTILGLAGLAISRPDQADRLATLLVERAPLDSVEALTDLRREEGADLLRDASASALVWIRTQMATPEAADDGRWALLHALEAELAGTASNDGLASWLREARAALDAGDVPTALRAARLAVDEVVEAADWLERATDDDPIDRRHSMRLLRDLDRELLADNTLTAVLALAPDRDPVRGLYSRALAGIENALLASEARPEGGTVPHGGLRVARLRALVRILDGVRRTSDGSGDADLGPRLAAVSLLMARAAADHSSLRRAVWAALTRSGDALLRDDHAEVTDLLLVWTVAFPDDDFAIVREASMIPEVGAVFDAYARLHQATWAAADPDDDDAIKLVAERAGELADALPPEQSPRLESVRLALARTGNQLRRITTAASHATVPAGAIDALGLELAGLARRAFGAHQRLGVPSEERSHDVEIAFHGIAAGLGRDARALDEAIAVASDTCRAALPPAIAGAVERVLLWLARRPHSDEAASSGVSLEVMLPGWVPLSRMLGGFHVVRPIGRGAGGSVLLAVRAEERNRTDRELVALKVPDYSGGAARNLSEQEFEQLFREEAGALLVLPVHKNLAGFITFDASAQPKPLLAMEFVRGMNLEQTLQQTNLEMDRALKIIDDLLAGIEAMHKVQIAHLDVKPANVVLREGSGDAVLVDFGLAGRRLRAGCGSVHYGAAEVWNESSTDEPFGADVYAAACVAFEVLTDTVLVRGDTIKEVIDVHFSKQPAAALLSALERLPRLGPLAELLRAALARESKRRPSAARLRAGFAAIAPDLRKLAWPIKI